jgi:hypothetical protein
MNMNSDKSQQLLMLKIGGMVGLVKRCALVGGKGEDMVTRHVTHPLMSLWQRPDLKTVSSFIYASAAEY